MRDNKNDKELTEEKPLPAVINRGEKMGTSHEKTDKNLRVVEQPHRRERSQNKGRTEHTTHYPEAPAVEESKEVPAQTQDEQIQVLTLLT